MTNQHKARRSSIGRSSLWLVGVLALTQANSLARDDVSITYDNYGTPLIKGTTDRAAYFGLGYATARDRFYQMSVRRLAGQGRLSQYFGRDGVRRSGAASASMLVDKLFEIDRTNRILGFRRQSVVRRQDLLAHHLPEFELLLAYSRGVNAWLTEVANTSNPTHPDQLHHPNFATFGIPIEPWLVEDSILVWMVTTHRFSSGLTAEIVNAAVTGYCSNSALAPVQRKELLYGLQPTVDRVATVVESEFDTTLFDDTQDYVDMKEAHHVFQSWPTSFMPRFSEAAAVAGARVDEPGGASSAASYLWGGPRIQIGVPGPLYEWHMESENFAVRGAGFAGSPNKLAGSTSPPTDSAFVPVAWTLCSSGNHLVDTFKIQPGTKADTYVVDGFTRGIVSHDESFQYKDDAGNLQTETLIVKRTLFGPILPRDMFVDRYNAITAQENFPVIPSDSMFALAHPMMADLSIVNQTQSPTPFIAFNQMYRASGATNFIDDVRRDYSYPSANMTLTDGSGTIAFTVTGAMPVRRPAPLPGNPGHDPEFEWAGELPMDGSLGASRWQEYVRWDVRPFAVNPAKGYFVNGNQLGFWSGHPLNAYYSRGGDVDERSFELRRLLSESLAAPGSKIPAATLRGFSGWSGRRSAEMLGEIVDFKYGGNCANLPYDECATAEFFHAWVNAGGQLDGQTIGAMLADFFDAGAFGLESFVETSGANYNPVIAVFANNIIDDYGRRNIGMLNMIEEVHRRINEQPAPAPSVWANEWAVIWYIARILHQRYENYESPTATDAEKLAAYRALATSKDSDRARIPLHYLDELGAAPPVAPGSTQSTADFIRFGNDPVSMETTTLAGVMGAMYNCFIRLNTGSASGRESMLSVGHSEKSIPSTLPELDPFDSELQLLETGGYKDAPCAFPSSSTHSRSVTLLNI